MVSLDRLGPWRAGLPGGRDLLVRRGFGLDRLRDLVLPENETASDHHMKARIILGVVLFLCSPMGQALACSVCYGAKDGKTTEHMAVAVWVMLGVVMSVMGGVGAFGFQIWRHANTPLEPHQELTDEDLDKYE